MLRRFSVNYAILSMVLDALFTVCALALAVTVQPRLHWPVASHIQSSAASEANYLIVLIIWGVSFIVMSVYDPARLYRAVDEFQIVTLSTIVAAMVFAGFSYLFFVELNRSLFVVFTVIDWIMVLGWRAVARILLKLTHVPAATHRVLVVGTGQAAHQIEQIIHDHAWMGIHLIGFLDDEHPDAANPGVIGDLADAREIVITRQIDDVVVALPQQAHDQINRLIWSLHDVPVNVRVVPDYFSLALYRATVDDFSGVPMINLRGPALSAVQRLVKRLFDLVVSTVTLVLVSPLLALIAILIKLDSEGPVVFSQMRAGENGRAFKMYKFRTMVYGAEKLQTEVNEVNGNGQLIHKKAVDPRVTRVGRILRRTSFDELLQLVNVLKGEMSLVGPRPELPWLVDTYEPWQRVRFTVPQGITGWWQVNGRAEKPMHLHTEDDLYYVKNYSVWLDVYIMLKTPWVILRGRGAY